MSETTGSENRRNTIRELRETGITVRALREGLDSSTPVGEAMLNLLIAVGGGIEPANGKERRAAAREARSQLIGCSKALTEAKAAQLVRLVQAGEPVAMAAEAFGISRAFAYRIVKDAEVAVSGRRLQLTWSVVRPQIFHLPPSHTGNRQVVHIMNRRIGTGICAVLTIGGSRGLSWCARK